jgi:Pentapeptide repeats (9 copies)
MRLRYLVALGIVTLAYVGCSYLVLDYLPLALSHSAEFRSVRQVGTRVSLQLESQDSIRAGAVTLLTASALGVAGFIAFLGFSAGRRESDRNIRISQDQLFNGALDTIAKQDATASIGAISLLTSIAIERPDLREAASSTLFALTRSRLKASRPIEGTLRNRNIDDLTDRDYLTAAALRCISRVPSVYIKGAESGSIVVRSLEGCDLRKWKIAGARFEVVSFAGSYLWDSAFIDCAFIKCSFSQVDWAGAELRRVRFTECDLQYTNIREASGLAVQAENCLGMDPDHLPVCPEWLTIS